MPIIRSHAPEMRNANKILIAIAAMESPALYPRIKKFATITSARYQIVPTASRGVFNPIELMPALIALT